MWRIILALFSLSAATIGFAQELAGYDDPEQVRSRLTQTPMSRIEGLWRLPMNGGTIAIERNRDLPGDHYFMVAVEPENRQLRPGTVVGELTSTGRKGYYDAKIMTAATDDNRTLKSPKNYTLSLESNDTRLIMRPYGKKWEVRWWTILPYMYRRLIKRITTLPDDLAGCHRLFPEPVPPIEPLYL